MIKKVIAGKLRQETKTEQNLYQNEITIAESKLEIMGGVTGMKH